MVQVDKKQFKKLLPLSSITEQHNMQASLYIFFSDFSLRFWVCDKGKLSPSS